MLELGMRLIYLSWRSFDREKQMLQKPRRQLIYQLVIKKLGWAPILMSNTKSPLASQNSLWYEKFELLSFQRGYRFFCQHIKVEKIIKGSMDSIASPSYSVKMMGGKVCLMCKGKTLLGVVSNLLETKGLLKSPRNVSPYYLK